VVSPKNIKKMLNSEKVLNPERFGIITKQKKVALIG